MTYVNSAAGNTGELSLALADKVSAMLAYWDKDLVCRFANNAYLDWMGRTKEEMVGKMRIDELLGALYEKNLPYIEGALAGKKQVFERDIPIPGGSGVRHSLATYYPDIKNGEVLGFFVHVADISSVKKLEREVSKSKRDTLRKIIETEENEKRYLVDILRESVNQRLVACKMKIEIDRKKDNDSNRYDDLSLQISEIVDDINLLCQNLTPTEIRMLGLTEALEHYISKAAAEQHKPIDFTCEDRHIEEIALEDKFALFRIVQNLTVPALHTAHTKNSKIVIHYAEPDVKIQLSTNGKMLLNKNSKEYNAIACRVDYYSGKITELHSEEESRLDIEFSITKKQ